eukprot:COSAG02_NODE_4217_length_5620_cov_17.851476_4_plen_772_part_00
MSSRVLSGSSRSNLDSEPDDPETASLMRKRSLDSTLERDIKEMFECFDVDDSKRLDADEFCDALSMLSIHLDAGGMRALFDEIDTSGGGDLEMEEWETMMTRSKKMLMGKTGPVVTRTEVANVVQSILVDTAHRSATRVQANWRGTTIRGGGGGRNRALSSQERQQVFQHRLSEHRLEKAAAHQNWVTHPVSWCLIQPGLKRLGIGTITQQQARAMFLMVQSSDQREGDHQSGKTVSEFSAQLYSLLLVPGKDGNPPLFHADDSAEIALWRTLVRRYLWLKLMHNTISASKTMHGARGQSQMVEEEKRMKAKIRRRTCFFEPDAGFRMQWDLVQVCVLLLTAVIVPLRVGFSAMDESDPVFWFSFDAVSDVYFIVDIIINCRTAYVDSHQKIVADSKKVFAHYVKTWFFIDVVACLPLNYILYISGSLSLPWLTNQGPAGATDAGAADGIKVLKVLRLLRLSKMLRVLKLKTITERYRDSPWYHNFLTSFKLLKLIMLLLYLSHFLACFWYLVGNADEETYAKTRYGWVSRNYNDGTWNDYTGSRPTSLVTRYVTALFHSLTDFGMEFAETDVEMTWISIQHIIYEAFMAYLTGVLAGEVIVGNAAKQKFSEKMGEISEFMQHHKIHRSTRMKVTAFYEHLNAKKTFFDEQEVLNEFPPGIRKEMIEEIYGANGALRQTACSSSIVSSLFSNVCLVTILQSGVCVLVCPVAFDLMRCGGCCIFWWSGGRVMQIPFIEMLNERLRFELCVLLQPLPARNGDVIINQGDYGDE